MISLLNFNSGHFILASTVLFFLSASYAILFSALLPTISILDVLARDNHYKYLALFIIPTGAYFVIANWVGWQYYRNS